MAKVHGPRLPTVFWGQVSTVRFCPLGQAHSSPLQWETLLMDLASVATRAISRGRSSSGVAELLRENVLFATLFTVGALLRTVVFFTYQPALLLQLDTIAYLREALGGSPSDLRPSLYPTLLKPALAVNNLALVPFVQHLGARHRADPPCLAETARGASPNTAALGAAPMLLDGYQLII
ncbi:MAG: hypothetical protein M3526_05275, partial [Actinomycetota bacterium]|nr:hypothetical protein [Actinomycetota bacterium]